jgi:hypothetical protein
MLQKFKHYELSVQLTQTQKLQFLTKITSFSQKILVPSLAPIKLLYDSQEHF